MIRAYQENDWEAVCTIYDLGKPDEMRGLVDGASITPLAQDARMHQYFLASEIWVHEEDGGVIGFIGRKENTVSWLFVHPAHRRKGIARDLLSMLTEKHQGDLLLNLTKSNQPARALYEGCGFEVYEEFEGNMYGRKIPALRMRLMR